MNSNKDLKLVVGAALNDEEARELGYRELGVVRLAEDDSIYVIFKGDELIEYENGDLEIDVNGFKPVSLPGLSDEVLLSPSITDEEWSFLCETFGGCDE